MTTKDPRQLLEAQLHAIDVVGTLAATRHEQAEQAAAPLDAAVWRIVVELLYGERQRLVEALEKVKSGIIIVPAMPADLRGDRG